MKNTDYNCITCTLKENCDELTGELITEFFCENGSKGIYILEDNPLKFSSYFFHELNANEIIDNAKNYITKLGFNAELTVEKVKSEDWSTSFHKYFVPFNCSKSFVIVPSWEEDFTPEAGCKVIKMDPSQAFGTGLHQTTQLCMEFIEELNFNDKTVLEIGTGTGILSIGCILSGAKQVVATDNDPLCEESSNENFEKNGVESDIEFRLGDLLNVVSETEKFDYLIANILPDPVIQIVAHAHKFLKPDSHIIFSGIIEKEGPRVIEACSKAGYTLVKQKQKEDWVAFLLKK